MANMIEATSPFCSSTSIPTFLKDITLATTPQMWFEQADYLYLQAAELRKEAKQLQTRIDTLNDRAEDLDTAASKLQKLATDDRAQLQTELDGVLQHHGSILDEYEKQPKRAKKLNQLVLKVEEGRATLEEIEAFSDVLHGLREKSITGEVQEFSSPVTPHSAALPTLEILPSGSEPTSTIVRPDAKIAEGNNEAGDSTLLEIKPIKDKRRISATPNNGSPSQDEYTKQPPSKRLKAAVSASGDELHLSEQEHGVSKDDGRSPLSTPLHEQKSIMPNAKAAASKVYSDIWGTFESSSSNDDVEFKVTRKYRGNSGHDFQAFTNGDGIPAGENAPSDEEQVMASSYLLDDLNTYGTTNMDSATLKTLASQPESRPYVSSSIPEIGLQTPFLPTSTYLHGRAWGLRDDMRFSSSSALRSYSSPSSPLYSLTSPVFSHFSDQFPLPLPSKHTNEQTHSPKSLSDLIPKPTVTDEQGPQESKHKKKRHNRKHKTRVAVETSDQKEWANSADAELVVADIQAPKEGKRNKKRKGRKHKKSNEAEIGKEGDDELRVKEILTLLEGMPRKSSKNKIMSKTFTT